MNKKSLIIPFLLIILTMNVYALSTFGTPSKVVSYSGQNMFLNSNNPILESTNYFWSGGKLFHKNFTYSGSLTFGGMNGVSQYYADDNFFYALSSSSLFYYSQKITYAGVTNQSIYARTDGQIYTDSGFDSQIENGLIAGNSYLVYTSNLTRKCAFTSTGFIKQLVGNDNGLYYFLGYQSGVSNTSRLIIFDNNCFLLENILLSTGFEHRFTYPHNNIGYTLDNDDNFMIYIDINNTNPIITTIDYDGNTLDGYAFISDLPIGTTSYNQLTFTDYNHFNVYDETNNIFYSLGYKNTNASEFYLIKFDVDTIGNIEHIDNDSVLTEQNFNDIGTDEYILNTTGALNRSSLMFLYNEDLYIELYDKISSNYDLITLATTYIDEYAGLTCNADHSVCFDTSSTCFDNTAFFNGVNISNWLCNNTVYSNSLYCNSDLVFCSGGCLNKPVLNQYGLNAYKGYCYNLSCTNDCTVNGQRYSDTSSSFNLCELQSDGCLGWTQTNCNSTQYSQYGLCKDKSYLQTPITILRFTNNPYTSLNIYGGQYGCPELTCTLNNGVFNCPVDTCGYANASNPNLESVTWNPNTQKLDVTTKNCNSATGVFELRLEIQGLNDSTTIGVDCNYKETIYDTILNKTFLVEGVLVQPLTSNNNFYYGDVANKNKETINLYTNSTTSKFYLNLSDGATALNTYIVTINNTNKEIIIQNINGTILVNDNYAQTIVRVELSLYQDFQNLESNILYTAYTYSGQVLGNKGVTMQNYDDIGATLSSNIDLNMISGTIFISKLQRTKMDSGIPSLYKTYYIQGLTDFKTKYENVGCTYINDGTYTARVYASENFLGQFFSYQDVIISKNTVTKCGTTKQDTGNIFDQLTPAMKIIIAFCVSFFALLILVIMGVIQNSESSKNILIFSGFFAFVGSLIIFSIVGWLPFWIVILCGILAGLGMYAFVIRGSQGG